MENNNNNRKKHPICLLVCARHDPSCSFTNNSLSRLSTSPFDFDFDDNDNDDNSHHIIAPNASLATVLFLLPLVSACAL